MTHVTPEHIIDECNRRLIAWVADSLGLQGAKREQLHSEMALLFAHVTANELAEYLCEKLSAKHIIENMQDARKTIRRFQTITHDWFAGTSEERRS